MILNETYTMSNGAKIPKIGLGTWLMDDGQAARAVKDAVALGYRHIDTAQGYGNEKGVGEGIRAGSIPREEIFITSKVAAERKDYDSAVKSIDETLEKLGFDYVDMMIIHAPQPWSEFRDPDKRYFKENREVWRAMEEAVKAGKIRTIGVSNFLEDDVENILEVCEIKPAVNQIPAHIGNTPVDLAKYCRSRDILVEAYSPIAHGDALSRPEIKEVARRYNVSAATLCVRYVLQLGMVALPKSLNPEHMRQDTEVDFTISDEDMELLR